MICSIHNKEFKGPNSRNNYWHTIDKDELGEWTYCSKAVIDVLNEAESKLPIKESREPLQDKQPNFMLRCNAMNNAIAYLNAHPTKMFADIEKIYIDILELLEK